MTAGSGKPDRREVPYYEQVANVLRARIVSEDDTRPITLPPERDLCDIHGVSRITIRKALDILEGEGLIERTPGRGTLTVPEAVQRYKRLRQSRVVHIVTNWQRLPDVPTSFYGQIYQGIFDAVEQAGYRLTIEQLQGRAPTEPPDVTRPDEAITLGVILVGMMSEPLIEVYAGATYPVVCVDYWSIHPGVDSIVVDCFAEGQYMADHLVRHGHSQLFYLGNIVGRTQKEPDAQLMLTGVQRRLEQAGLPPIPPDRIRFCIAQPKYIDEAAEWIARMQPRPTAGVVFQADVLERLVEVFGSMGIRCPEDISLITKTSIGREGAASCMKIDARVMGELAVHCLLERVSGTRATTLRIAVPSELHVGTTVCHLDPISSAPPTTSDL